jgi:hypothetical protein
MGVAARRKREGKNGGDKMTTAQAKAILEAEQQGIVQACNKEIQAALTRHSCILEGVPIVVPAGNGGFVLAANVAIRIKPEEKKG